MGQTRDPITGQKFNDGSAQVETDWRTTYPAIRYYTGDPGTTTREVTWTNGIDAVRVVVEAVEPTAGTAEEPAVRVAFNMSTTMGDAALADRDTGQYGELPYFVATVDKPLELIFDTTFQKVWNAVFIEDNTAAITGVRFEGVRYEG